MREVAAIPDFNHSDRIVVGSTAALEREVMTELYRTLYINRSPIVVTNWCTEDLIKYATNAFLAPK